MEENNTVDLTHVMEEKKSPVTIEYKFTRVQSKVDPVTLEVRSLVVGLTAFVKENESINAYIDTEVFVDAETLANPVEISHDEVRNICLQTALSNNWYNQLRSSIEQQVSVPVEGSSFTI